MKKSMKKSFLKAAFAIGFAVLTFSAYADQGNSGKGMGMDMGGMKMDCMENMKGMKMDCMGAGSAKAASMSEGEVKAVDKANKNITLKHGPIENMHMGPMTMAFPVKDPSLLSRVNVGDKVNFRVENVKDIATVTALTVQK
jgi:Cu(I)/Ag(I) efflux system periplasmic protein CusF